MTDLGNLSAEQLRSMLAGHDCLIIRPGEILVVTVPPWWSADDCRDVMTAINAYCGPEIRALVVPGKAEVARMPPDPFAQDA